MTSMKRERKNKKTDNIIPVKLKGNPQSEKSIRNAHNHFNFGGHSSGNTTRAPEELQRMLGEVFFRRANKSEIWKYTHVYISDTDICMYRFYMLPIYLFNYWLFF